MTHNLSRFATIHVYNFLHLTISKQEILQTIAESVLFYKTTCFTNLEKHCREWMIGDWREIVIMPEDKGSKIFVLDREDCAQRVLVYQDDVTNFVVIEDHAAATHILKHYQPLLQPLLQLLNFLK